MSFANGNFTTSIDYLGLPYFLYVTRHTNLRNASRGDTAAAFYQAWIGIAPSAGKFSQDLTSVDDILLAFLSLVFILTLEAICAIFIQRSSFSYLSLFSLLFYKTSAHSPSTTPPTQAPPHQFPPPRRRRRRIRRLPPTATTFSSTLSAFLVLMLQISIIVLTSRRILYVSNTESTFQLSQPFNPDWNAAWNHSLTLGNQPCLSVAFYGPTIQRTSTITSCLSSTLPPSFQPFLPTSKPTIANITSLLHSYGAEHYVTIDGRSATFSARALFSLHDLRLRILQQRLRENDVDLTMFVVHRQYIAYLFTAYVRDTGDESMDLQRLRELNFESTAAQAGPELVVARTDNGSGIIRTQSVRYTTIVRGIIPQGEAALRFGQSVLKGAIAVEHVGPSDVDLLVNEGQYGVEAVVWWERVRIINLLSMVIVVAVGGVALFGVKTVRWRGKKEWERIGERVQESSGSGIVDDTREVDKKFMEYGDYHVGAETPEGIVWGVDGFEEYDRVGRRWRAEPS